MTVSPSALTVERTATLAALADVLVPAVPPWPSASEAGVAETWAARSLAALPGHASLVSRALDAAASGEPIAEIECLEREDREAFDALVLVVVGAYYLSPKVRRLLGWAGPRRNPPVEGEAEFYLEDGLLDPVVERGPIYRPTP